MSLSPELARLAAFLIFLALGLAVRLRRRWALGAFFAYTLGLYAAVGLTQKDAWPFTSYPIAVGLAGGDQVQTRLDFVGVDRSGREWTLDPGTWSPLFPQTLQLWFERSYPTLPPEARRRGLAFLLERAEAARAQLWAEKRIGHRRWLGPLAAPDWSIVYPRGAPGPERYAALRVYRLAWRPRGGAVERTLIAEP